MLWFLCKVRFLRLWLVNLLVGPMQLPVSFHCSLSILNRQHNEGGFKIILNFSSSSLFPFLGGCEGQGTHSIQSWTRGPSPLCLFFKNCRVSRLGAHFPKIFRAFLVSRLRPLHLLFYFALFSRPLLFWAAVTPSGWRLPNPLTY